MANLSQINKKIKSVKSTSKITNALKVVSSNKTSVYKELKKVSSSYLRGIYKIFFELYNSTDHDIRSTNKKLIQYVDDKHELWVVLGTDIGMCGDFNEKLKKYLDSSFKRGLDGLIVMGKKLIFSLKREYGDYFEFERSSELNTSDVQKSLRELSRKIFGTFISKHYMKLTLIYLKDPAEGIIEKINILPFTEKYFVNKKKIYVRTMHANVNYPEVIIDLFPSYLECVILGAIMSSKIAEHTIRRDLMYTATKNANELLDDYTLTFNKLRQANITQEITEITVSVQSKKK